MPDLGYENLQTIEKSIDTTSLLINITTKIIDNKTVETIKENKPATGVLAKILTFLSKFKIFKKIYDYVKKSSFINFVINLADRYLSVHEKIQKLKFYKFLNGCGISSVVINFIWWLLELIGIIPKKKKGWLKFLDGAIHIFGYITGLAMDILDIVFNPILPRKIAAITEITLSTVSLGIHLHKLIKY